MKTLNRFVVALGMTVFFLLSLVPNGEGQAAQLSYASAPAQMALTWTFTASSAPTGAISVNGLRYWQILFIPSGTVSSCSLSLDSNSGSGFSTGGIISAGTIGSCATAGSYSNSSAATPTLQGQITPTITGTGTVTVVLLGYVNNPGAAGSASSTIVAPVDGSGNVKVNCAAGCTGSNPNGQALMAASAPVVIASNQSAVAVTAAQATAANFNATVVGSGNFNTQPAGFSSSPLSGQQAVTASAVNLGANATHSVCITALITNTIPVYVGGSGETTSTGLPLNAGDAYCWQVTNSNLLYVIATTTGASVAWTAQ